jgi:hypothetical protein
MDIISPVIKGLEGYEVKNDESDIAALRSPEGIYLTRWAFTEEERKAVAAGEDLFVSSLTYNHPFQALKIEVGITKRPETIKREMRLVDEYELRTLLNELNGRIKHLEDKKLKVLNGDKELADLAKKAHAAKEKLERKKAEVFSDKPAPSLALAN